MLPLTKQTDCVKKASCGEPFNAIFASDTVSLEILATGLIAGKHLQTKTSARNKRCAKRCTVQSEKDITVWHRRNYVKHYYGCNFCTNHSVLYRCSTKKL